MMIKDSFTCDRCSGTGIVSEEKLTPLQRKVYRLVRSARNGIKATDLIRQVYKDALVPTSPLTAIHTAIRNINQRIRSDRRIVTEGRSKTSTFRLVNATEGEQHGETHVSRSGNVHRVQHHRRDHGGTAAGKTE